MSLHQRAYKGQSDWQAVAELIQADDYFYHRVDFPWRLCSTSLEDQRNAAIWDDEHGQMQVFATLQFPWLTLDYAMRPAIRSWELEKQIIHWAETRLHQIAHEWAPRVGLSEGDVQSYLSDNIHYYLDAAHIEGLELYYRFAQECGALPTAPALDFLEITKPALI
jgi:hypothetical protein